MIISLLNIKKSAVKFALWASMTLMTISAFYAVHKVYFDIPIEQGVYPIYVNSEPGKHIASAEFYSKNKAVFRFVAKISDSGWSFRHHSSTKSERMCKVQLKQNAGKAYLEILSYEDKAIQGKDRCTSEMDALGSYLILNSDNRLISCPDWWELPEKRKLKTETSFWLSICFLFFSILFQLIHSKSRYDKRRN